MFSTAKKVDLQFATEATKFEPPTFEEFLGGILLHMFRRGNKAKVLSQYANCISIQDVTSGVGTALNTQ